MAAVRAAEFDPASGLLLTVGRGVRVSDPRSGDSWVDLAEPDRCCAAAFAPGGERFAIGTFDGVVTVHATEDGQTLRTLPARAREITRIVFEPERDAVVVAAWDGRVVRYGPDGSAVDDLQLDHRREPDFEHGVCDVASTPCGLLFTVEGAVGLVTLAGDVARHEEENLYEPRIAVVYGAVALVVATDQTLLLTLPGLEVTWRGPGGLAAALSPDGARAVVAGDEHTELFDVSVGVRLARFAGHPTATCAVAFTSSGGLRSGGEDGRVLELQGARQVAGIVAEHPRRVRWLFDEGRVSVGADGSVRCDAGDLRPVVFPEPRAPDSVIALGSAGFSARWLPDGSVLAVAADHTGRYDAESGECLARRDVVGSVAVSPAGTVAVSRDDGLVVLDGAKLAPRRLVRGWVSVQQRFLDDVHLMTGRSRKGVIIDVSSGAEVLELGYGAPFFVGALPRSRALVDEPQLGLAVIDHTSTPGVEHLWKDARRPVLSADGGRLFYLKNGLHLVDVDTRAQLLHLPDVSPHASVAAWAANGSRAAYLVKEALRLCDRDGELQAEVRVPRFGRAHSLAVSTTGLVAGGAMWDGAAFVWNPQSTELRWLPSGGDGIATVRWLDPDRLLVKVQRENRDQAYLYDACGELVAKLLGFRPAGRARIRPVFPTVHVAGDLLVTALRDDGVLRAFHRDDGHLVFEHAPTAGTLRDVELTPDGRRLLALDDAGEVRIHTLDAI